MNDDSKTQIAETPAIDNSQLIDDYLATEFRVVITSQKRRGLRLEKLYWRLLKDIAEKKGLKRSRLIASILESSEGSAISNASQLRGFVTKTLETERNELADRISEKSIIQLIHKAPIPSFAIDRQKHLKNINKEFIQLLRVISGDMNQQISTDSVSLTLDTPIDMLFSDLERSGQTACYYSLRLNEKQRRGRTTIITVPPEPYTILIGFIVS